MPSYRCDGLNAINKYKHKLLTMAVSLLLCSSAQGFVCSIVPGPGRCLEETLYDALDRITRGTATTDSDGVTTYRDSNGRITGTARRLPGGRTEFRDAEGRLIGTTQ
jgi:hypothetical protein